MFLRHKNKRSLVKSFKKTMRFRQTDFLPLDFLGVSHRILLKNENAVYRLQIPALVPEILMFEKCVNMQMR